MRHPGLVHCDFNGQAGRARLGNHVWRGLNVSCPAGAVLGPHRSMHRKMPGRTESWRSLVMAYVIHDLGCSTIILGRRLLGRFGLLAQEAEYVILPH